MADIEGPQQTALQVSNLANADANQATQLAVADQQHQQNAINLQQQQQQLSSLKAQHSIALLNNFGKMDPKFRNVALDTFKNQARQAGTPMDSMFDAMAKDPEFTQNVAALTGDQNATQKMHDDPVGFLRAISSTNPMDWQNGMKQVGDAVKQDMIGKRMQDVEQMKGQFGNQHATIMANGRQDQMQDRMDTRVHTQVVNNLQKDPELKQRFSQYGNLQNALSSITDAKDLTPEGIAEFQQAVRSNMGIKGSGGVGERAETYLNPLGLRAEHWKEMLTGDPADIAKDSNLVEHFKDLARIEMKNIQNVSASRLNTLTKGHGSMYSRRPDLKADLEDAASAMSGQFKGNEGAQGQQGAARANPTASPQRDALATTMFKASQQPGYSEEGFKAALKSKGVSEDEINEIMNQAKVTTGDNGAAYMKPTTAGRGK